MATIGDAAMDENALFEEVENMCDQKIKELSVMSLESKTSYIIVSVTRLRVAVALCARTLMPAVLRIFYVYLRNQQLLVNNVRHRLFPSIVAFLANSLSTSLASVQNLSKRSIKNEDILQDVTSLTPEPCVDCQVLFSPVGEIQADVVFIHGLHGGIDRTWRQGRWRHGGHKLQNQRPVEREKGKMIVLPREGSLKRTLGGIYSKSPSKVRKKGGELCATREEGEWEVVQEEEEFSDCWPQDWLPKDCPGARVIALNYTTDVLWCPVWKKKRNRTDMVSRSDEMIQKLLQLGVGKRPIIWVGHSKGGLFIKQIIMNAWERHNHSQDIFNILQNTKGIMFYSVPHKGSSLADVTVPLLRRSVELIEIQRNCDFVLDLHKRFLDLCKNGHLKADIFSFIETSFTLMSFVFLKIVSYESADLDVGVKCDVPLDHREICKPAGRDCFLYLELIKMIKKYTG